MKVVFASNNAGKICEMRELLKNFPLEIIPQAELNVSEIPEIGLTFVENAIMKARHASFVTGLPAIADDSGLEVRALAGAPGIYSARYAGENATSQTNIQKLLDTLINVPLKKRSALFRCVLVYLASPEDPAPLICQGTWHGEILQTPQGNKGFGYDPIFYDYEKKCSAAELSLDIKNQISHRGKALQILVKNLAEKLQG